MIRHVYLETAGWAVELIGHPEVRGAWERESVLEGFRVGGLVGHLARAVLLVEEYLDNEVPGEETISAAQALAALRDTDEPGAEWNIGVRRRGEETAEGGPEALLARTRDVLERLRVRLPREPDERRMATSGGTVLLLDEYLRTRLVELSVHIDDVATSVGVRVPDLPPGAYRIAVETLVGAAVLRHGCAAVLRALTRRERDMVEALRVL